MGEVIIIEPDITEEENAYNLKVALEVLEKIANENVENKLKKVEIKLKA